MVIDSSALVAIVFGETDAGSFLDRIAAASGVAVSAVSLVESTMVVESRQGAKATADLELLLQRVHAEIVPVDAEQATAALTAWRRFGKGRHPAGLNLGDCFVYALARTRGDELLFKGEDFTQTDIRSARH